MILLKKQETKKRLDVVIHERRPDLSRSLIQSWIQQGLVMVVGKIVTKNGMLVEPDVDFVLQNLYSICFKLSKHFKNKFIHQNQQVVKKDYNR